MPRKHRPARSPRVGVVRRGHQSEYLKDHNLKNGRGGRFERAGASDPGGDSRGKRTAKAVGKRVARAFLVGGATASTASAAAAGILIRNRRTITKVARTGRRLLPR